MSLIQRPDKQLLCILIPVCLILLYFIPFLSNGAGYFRYHDFLDSNLVWYKILSESGKIFAPNGAPIDNIMSASRISLGNEFDLVFWLVHLAGPYYGLVINELLIRLIAFLGMYLLLRDLFKNTDLLILSLISLLFAFLPFWAPGGISSAGQPLLFWAFRNLFHKKESKASWLIILLFPFYSSFFIYTIFFLGFIAAYFIYYWYKNKRIPGHPIAAFIAIIVVSIFVNYRYVDGFVLNNLFIPHRVSFHTENSFTQSVSETIGSFLNGQNHVPSFHKTIILPLLVLTLLLYLFMKDMRKSLWVRTLIGGFIVLGMIACFHGFWDFSPIARLRKSLAILNTIQLDRWYTLYPFIWYLLFATALVLLTGKWKSFRYLALGICAIQFLLIIRTNHLLQGKRKPAVTPSYSQFYAEPLFKQIKEKIGKPANSYKVISLGIHPAQPQYNGFHTIDGYLALYPLDYKLEFGKLMRQELDSNKANADYFDTWGSRCYLFDNKYASISETGMMKTPAEYHSQALLLNKDLLRKMNCQYLISAIKIDDTTVSGLKELGQFEDQYWRLYLYQFE